jgi:hypothetical protein
VALVTIVVVLEHVYLAFIVLIVGVSDVLQRVQVDCMNQFHARVIQIASVRNVRLVLQVNI